MSKFQPGQMLRAEMRRVTKQWPTGRPPKRKSLGVLGQLGLRVEGSGFRAQALGSRFSGI